MKNRQKWVDGSKWNLNLYCFLSKFFLYANSEIPLGAQVF